MAADTPPSQRREKLKPGRLRSSKGPGKMEASFSTQLKPQHLLLLLNLD
jgi:hypothetical protein